MWKQTDCGLMKSLKLTNWEMCVWGFKKNKLRHGVQMGFLLLTSGELRRIRNFGQVGANVKLGFL